MMRLLVLASSSPRRRSLLKEHAIPHEAVAPPFDDGELRPGSITPEGWVVALAHLKARAVADRIKDEAVVMGCDTVVIKDGEIIGQPADADDARRIITRLSAGSHRVISGVALIESGSDERRFLIDGADVRVGALEPATIDSYIDSGSWRGKAGAYNLMDRIGAGWPIEYAGDPTTVMGLPMRRLAPLLGELGLGAQERV